MILWTKIISDAMSEPEKNSLEMTRDYRLLTV